jgi:hypothetical protein
MRGWLWLAGAVFVAGCGGDDDEPGRTGTGGTGAGGTSSGGASSGGSGGTTGGSGGTTGGSGGTTGGSGGVAGSGNSSSGGVAGSVNVGGSAGDGGKGGALNDACYAMCDQQETGDNCIPEYTKTCKDGCDLMTPGLVTKCPDEAEAYYDCNASIEYMCVLALPVAKDQTACQAENDAFAACT